jgi:hypothetical protein
MTKYEDVGAFMLKLCKDRQLCKKLVDNPELATEELRKILKTDMPVGHKIIMHLDEENVTHVIIPQKKDIEAAEASFTFKGPRDRPYPPEYVMNPLGTIIERDDPMRAFAFLVGEYTLRRCKN